MKFKNGDRAIVARTNSYLDGDVVTIVGCVAAFPVVGTIYIIESDITMFEAHGSKWKTVPLTEACLDPYIE